MSKIVLVDGHSILNRAFYGVPDLTNSEGLHTNAVYGFLNILFHFLNEEKPDYLTVAFDMSAPTFRHAFYPAYKGTRKPMLPELKEQVPLMKEVLTAMGIRIVQKEGLEADDILGTIAKRAEKEGMEVSLISGDRDLLQIATEHIKIRIPKTKGNQTTVEDYYTEDVIKAYGVDPITFIDLKGLMGDTSDNIPGIAGVGPKTATDLLLQFGSLDGIYAHVEEIQKKNLKEKLLAGKENAYLSKKLATIDVNADFSYAFDEAVLGDIFTAKAYELFKKLGFKKFLDKFSDKGVSVSKEISVKTQMVSSRDHLAIVVNTALLAPLAGLSFAYLPGDDSLLSIGADGQMSFSFEEKKERLFVFLCTDREQVYCMDSELLTMEAVKNAMTLLVTKGQHVCGYNIKSYYPYLQQDICTSSQAVGALEDVMILSYLLNPIKGDYPLEDIAGQYGNVSMQGYKEVFGSLSLREAFEAKKEEFYRFYSLNACMMMHTYPALMDSLTEQDMVDLYREIELPLTYVLYSMEKDGICVQKNALSEYARMLGDKMEVLEKRIYEAAGENFNINSPKQLGVILFEKLGLPGGKKTKSGYSTAADVLEGLAPQAPIVQDILEYRGLSKLKGTYADGLADFIGEDGKIHTTLHQCVTATGRLSSADPNLQNIPMRTEMGRQIRKVFVPEKGNLFVDGDYSQVELRILAHMAGDEELIEAYRQGRDIHTTTASKVFGVPFEEVTDLQRRNAKAVNFGIVYGISAFGLSQDLGISKKEAQEYIDAYFATYPKVKEYLDRTVLEAKEKGYCVTLYNRRRPIPELSSSNFMQRQFGERVAMNAPIQGTAADIMKLAMLRVFDRLVTDKLRSRLILQIHDELLIETQEEEKDRVLALLEEEMENAAKLSVNLSVSAHCGIDFYEVK